MSDVVEDASEGPAVLRLRIRLLLLDNRLTTGVQKDVAVLILRYFLALRGQLICEGLLGLLLRLYDVAVVDTH